MARGDNVSLAEALEKNKSTLIIARFQIFCNAKQLSEMNQTLDEMLSALRGYHSVIKRLNPLQKQMKALMKKLDECSSTQFFHKKVDSELDGHIASGDGSIPENLGGYARITMP